MRKPILCGVMAALAVPAAAFAETSKDPKPDEPTKAYCTPKEVAYKARGVLVANTLAQTAGADTARKGDDRYSGEIVVTVTRSNRKGQTGEQTYTLENARVRFSPRNDTETAAGDRVKVFGKITKLGKKCDKTGFTPSVTVRKVGIKAGKAAKA